jgi:glycosyltransferase involved in cell wall biosynthesis
LLVSVIIPNYNYARFLRQRFRSILDQTFRDFEIIFLDDASTDESVSLVRAHFNADVARLEVNGRNSGNPFVQWNRGVRLARGEYIWIAEADDLCTPDFLERLLGAMVSRPSVGLAYCNTTPIDTAGEIIDGDFYHRYVSDLDPHRWFSDFAAPGADEVRHYLARKNTITNVSGVMFRRDVYVRAGYAPEDLRMCGDWMTYCRLLHHSDVAYVSAPLNFHRQHPEKHTQNSVLDLTYFREFLKVQEYVASAFDLGARERRAAFDRFLGEWNRLTISNYGRIDLSRTLALAQMTARSYRGAAFYGAIARRLLVNGARSLAGKWRTG